MSKLWRETAIEALKDSIKHWENMRDHLDAQGHVPGPDQCACCNEWLYDDLTELYCFGCPIEIHADTTGCGNTPYADAAELFMENVDSPEWRQAAQDMIDYLKQTLDMVERKQINH